MKPYDPEATCPKCRFTSITAQWAAAWTQLWLFMMPKPKDWKPETRPERIIRTCAQCKYEWTEAPLDTPIPVRSFRGVEFDERGLPVLGPNGCAQPDCVRWEAHGAPHVAKDGLSWTLAGDKDITVGTDHGGRRARKLEKLWEVANEWKGCPGRDVAFSRNAMRRIWEILAAHP